MMLHNKTLAFLVYILTFIPPSLTASSPDTFDIIIVGGGTAGLTLANRLSAIPELTIAVIEPGKDEGNNPNVTSVEGLVGTNGLNTHVDWNYETTPQKLSDERRIEYHAGKAWGGTSTINGMTYIRPAKQQLDAWETLGNPGWNWGNLWPYHLKSEIFSPPTHAQVAAGASYIDSYHGRTGPVNVAYQYGLQNGSFAAVVNETWRNLDVPLNEDVNGGDLRGFFVWPQTLDRERNVRVDAARAYYYPVRERMNLVVLQGRVDRILWDDGDGEKVTAKGVEYTDKDGNTQTLCAEKEVILSAGSVRSPAILELSGVGNPELLSKYNIPIKISLPTVGENAIDQPNSFISYASNLTFNGMVPYVTYLSASDIFGAETNSVAEGMKSQLKCWAEKVAADGSTNGAISAQAVEQLYKAQHDLIFKQDVPFVEILTTGIGSNVGSAFFILLPFSRGSVHIDSADPAEYPSINPNYFMVEWDLALQRRLAQLTTKFWDTHPVRSFVGERLQPTLQVLPDDATDDDWDRWIKSSFTANHHLLGTAAMLPRELGGVVDSNLVVYGTENVRVVDASILPTQVSGHLTSVLYAVAERAADLIIETL
ncbi:hypothetical protein BDV18DRAFT_159737 [Aspergillus unguis]